MSDHKYILFIAAATLLAGCGTNTQRPAETAAATPTPVIETDAFADLRQKITDSGCPAGIISLGYDQDGTPEAMSDYSKYSSALTAYPCLADVTAIIDSGSGTPNAFCFIPKDKDAHVQIYDCVLQDDGTVTEDTLLYESDEGSPVILRCMVGDVFTSARITIVNPDGTSLTDYGPFFSGIDGSLIAEDDYGSACYDLTTAKDTASFSCTITKDVAEKSLITYLSSLHKFTGTSTLVSDTMDYICVNGTDVFCYIYAMGDNSSGSWVIDSWYAVNTETGEIYGPDPASKQWTPAA